MHKTHEQTAPRPGFQRTIAERRFGTEDRAKRLRNRLGRLLLRPDKLADFVRRSGVKEEEHENATEAMRLHLRGYTKPEVSRAIGVPVSAVARWWLQFEAYVFVWVERERGRAERSAISNQQSADRILMPFPADD